MANRINILSQHVSPPEALIRYQSIGQLFTATLNRPKALNALNLTMIDSLLSQIDTMNQHQVVWLRGQGTKSFCAGGDVKSLFTNNLTVDQRLSFFKSELLLNYRMTKLKALLISCWDGLVFGGGAGLTIYSPIIIATERTIFSLPEARIGAFVSVGCYHAMARMRNNLGYYLGMTETRLCGEDVFISGLAHFYIPSQKLPTAYEEIVRAFCTKTEDPRRLASSILKKYHTPSGRTVLRDEQNVKALFGLPSAKAIYQKAVSEKDDFHAEIASMMRRACPMSTELIYRSISSARSRTLVEQFKHQLQMIIPMVKKSDFEKGVRKILLEKQQDIRWCYPSYEAVTEEEIVKLLSPQLVDSLQFE